MAFDVNDPTDVAELKDEVITTNPLGLPYNWTTGDTGQVLDTINAKNYTVEKPAISAADVRALTTYDAYNNLAIDEQEWIRWMTGSNGVDNESVRVTDDLKKQLTGDGTPADSIWAVADRTEMVAAMDSLINVPGSRAEVLWGYGTTISRNDWFAARDS